jgi:hypothetical protein
MKIKKEKSRIYFLATLCSLIMTQIHEINYHSFLLLLMILFADYPRRVLELPFSNHRFALNFTIKHFLLQLRDHLHRWYSSQDINCFQHASGIFLWSFLSHYGFLCASFCFEFESFLSSQALSLFLFNFSWCSASLTMKFLGHCSFCWFIVFPLLCSFLLSWTLMHRSFYI